MKTKAARQIRKSDSGPAGFYERQTVSIPLVIPFLRCVRISAAGWTKWPTDMPFMTTKQTQEEDRFQVHVQGGNRRTTVTGNGPLFDIHHYCAWQWYFFSMLVAL
jgi:hypothetical protein